MMSDSKPDEQTPVIDSETSLDYYVTTVNGQTSKKSVAVTTSNAKEEATGIVVSVDRAGSVKVRKRKKSKRRKKKSNLALEEDVIKAIDDGALSQSSDSEDNQNKVPRRSSSLSEKDLRKNTKLLITDIITHDQQHSPNALNGNQELTPVVRRRVKKRSSFKHNRRGIIVDNSEADLSTATTSSFPDTMPSEPTSLPSQHSQPNLPSALTASLEPMELIDKKKLSRQNALATLDALMVEVQEATTVAKQQEGQRKKDLRLRKSYSLNELVGEDVEERCLAPDDFVPDLPELTPRKTSSSSSKPPLRSHQKSESFGQHSILSGGGSVFMSDPDAPMEESPPMALMHPPLAKTSSEGTGRSQRSHLLLDYVMDTDTSMLKEMLSNDQSVLGLTDRNQSQPKKPKDFDYGITHLEQVCKLMEQIGALRNQNKALVKRVHELESQVKELTEGKDRSHSIPRNSLDTFQISSKKTTDPVGRLKDAISKTRKSSFAHPSSDSRGTISQPFLLTDGFNEPLPFASSVGVPSGQRVIHSDIQLKKAKRPAYSRDDLDLSPRERWKFWKAPSRGVDLQPSRKRVVSTIKAEHAQGSATHLKSASVTLDSLLSNIDNDFSQKMLQWQSSVKSSRAHSRSSETGSDSLIRTNPGVPLPPSEDDAIRFKAHPTLAEGKAEVVHKSSFRKKLSKWEKVAAKKLSLDKRSNSVDRMNILKDLPNAEPSSPRHSRTMSAGADFHKSLPCVMTASTESRLKQLKRSSVHDSVNSVEWSGLQEAFPTTDQLGNKPLSSLLGASHSRLVTTPLRKKSGFPRKRKTWSFGKKTSSKYYLPTSSEFQLRSNLEAAESIGDQLTLELDSFDVSGLSAGINDEELNHLKQNTADLREKLHRIENDATQLASPKELHHSTFHHDKHLNDSFSSADNHAKRVRCPFFPSVKTRRSPSSVFV